MNALNPDHWSICTKLLHQSPITQEESETISKEPWSEICWWHDRPSRGRASEKEGLRQRSTRFLFLHFPIPYDIRCVDEHPVIIHKTGFHRRALGGLAREIGKMQGGSTEHGICFKSELPLPTHCPHFLTASDPLRIPSTYPGGKRNPSQMMKCPCQNRFQLQFVQAQVSKLVRLLQQASGRYKSMHG